MGGRLHLWGALSPHQNPGSAQILVLFTVSTVPIDTKSWAPEDSPAPRAAVASVTAEEVGTKQQLSMQSGWPKGHEAWPWEEVEEVDGAGSRTSTPTASSSNARI